MMVHSQVTTASDAMLVEIPQQLGIVKVDERAEARGLAIALTVRTRLFTTTM